MTYGYARCSTNETKQDIDRQVRELKQAGAEQVFLEYEHGDAALKQNLETLLAAVQEGDTIVTLEVSRLSRSTRQLCDIIEIIRAKKVCLQIVGSVTVDCTKGKLDAMTTAFLQMAGVFAELELAMVRQRVKSGIENARAKGKRLGRPATKPDDIPQIFYKHYPLFAQKKITLAGFAKLCSMSRTTIYKYIGLLAEAQPIE